MSDFRVEVPVPDDWALVREVDWDRVARVWTSSEREFSGVRWIEGLEPSPRDLAELASFFGVTGRLPDELLLKMSPGELVAIADSTSIAGVLCPSCGEHWLIYRGDESGWRLWGRDCNFKWHVAEDAERAASAPAPKA